MTGVKQFVFLQPLAQADVEQINKTSQDQVQVEAIFKSVVANAPYTLTGATVTAKDSQGNDVTASLIGATSTVAGSGKVLFVLKGGTSGKKYLICIDASSAENPNMRGAIKVKVKDLKA